MEKLENLSQGNPGALTFLMEFLKPENAVKGIVILIKINEIPSLKGTNLYVLWSDLCQKDLDKVETLCNKCPNDILEDACSRQDYSGAELVKEYLN